MIRDQERERVVEILMAFYDIVSATWGTTVIFVLQMRLIKFKAYATRGIKLRCLRGTISKNVWMYSKIITA